MDEREPLSVRVVCAYGGRVIALEVRLLVRETEESRKKPAKKKKKKFPRNDWSCVRTAEISELLFHGQINPSE